MQAPCHAILELAKHPGLGVNLPPKHPGLGVNLPPKLFAFGETQELELVDTEELAKLPLQLRAAVITGVPHLQETEPPWDPTLALCLGPYGGPRGGGVFL